MNITAVLIVLIIFSALTAVIFGPTYLKWREKREMQATVRHAIDKGQTLPADMLDAMTREVASKLPSRSRDLRRGVIWLAGGIGLAAFSVISNMGGWNDHDIEGVAAVLMGVAAIPATIGLAFIVLSFFNPNKD